MQISLRPIPNLNRYHPDCQKCFSRRKHKIIYRLKQRGSGHRPSEATSSVHQFVCQWSCKLGKLAGTTNGPPQSRTGADGRYLSPRCGNGRLIPVCQLTAKVPDASQSIHLCYSLTLSNLGARLLNSLFLSCSYLCCGIPDKCTVAVQPNRCHTFVTLWWRHMQFFERRISSAWRSVITKLALWCISKKRKEGRRKAYALEPRSPSGTPVCTFVTSLSLNPSCL